MDGFHYSRQQLQDISAQGKYTYEQLIARRGSPWTFDAESLVKALATARAKGKASFPVYSRKLSDPVPDGVQLLPSHKIVIVEGNYLLNWDDRAWAGLRDVFDERWFISCPEPEKQRQRLIRRHLETWTAEKERMFGSGEVGAARKADSNDVLNAQYIEGHRKYADFIIDSV
jgi:pantothenate kinase